MPEINLSSVPYIYGWLEEHTEETLIFKISLNGEPFDLTNSRYMVLRDGLIIGPIEDIPNGSWFASFAQAKAARKLQYQKRIDDAKRSLREVSQCSHKHCMDVRSPRR